MNIETELKIEALKNLRSKIYSKIFLRFSGDYSDFESIDNAISDYTESKKKIGIIENELNKLDPKWNEKSIFTADDIPF